MLITRPFPRSRIDGAAARVDLCAEQDLAPFRPGELDEQGNARARHAQGCGSAHTPLKVGIHRVQVGFEPRPGTINGDFPDGDGFASDLSCRSPGKIDVDRCNDAAASKRRGGTTATQQRLVDVVVENFTKPSLILLTQIA